MTKIAEGVVVITYDQRDDVLIVHLNGRLDAISAPGAEKELSEKVDEGHHKLIFDFQKLTYLSSAGMRTLLAISKKLKSLSGKLYVANVQKEVMEVLRMSSFDHILEIVATEEAAYKKFHP